MKAAVVEGANNVVYQEIEKPEPGPGQVRIRVAYTGICGSDIPRVLQGKCHSFPQILGHEFSGDVDAVGAGVDEALLGVRASAMPLVPCMECADCAAGNYALCKHYSFIGSRQPGSMAEYVVIPARNVFPVSDAVDYLQAAFFEPATVALHGIELAKVREGASALVVGCGTIGILLAQALAGYGITRVVATQRRPERFDRLHNAGIANVVATEEEDWLDKAKELGECPGGFDYVFDVAGTPQTILDSFAAAGNKGTVCFVGTPKSDVTFSVSQWENINRKELLVTGSWMSYSAPWPGVEWDKCADFFARGIMHVTQEMLDEVYLLSQTAEAFERFAEPGGVKGKILINSREE